MAPRSRVGATVAAAWLFAGWAAVVGVPGARAQGAGASSATPPEFTYIAAGLVATLVGEGPEERLAFRTRPVAKAGLIVRRQGDDRSSVEYGLLRSGAEVTRLLQVRGDSTSVAADGQDTLWVAVTKYPSVESPDGGVTRVFTIRDLDALPRPTSAAVGGTAPGIAFPDLAEGVTARVVAELALDPGDGGWELPMDAGVVSAESRIGLIRLRETVVDERGPQPGRVALDVLDGDGGWHAVGEVIAPWNERDGLAWMMPNLLAAPDGAVWMSSQQRRGPSHAQQWVKVDGLERVLKSHGGVLHDEARAWNGTGYPPQQPGAFKPLLAGLTVKQVAPCSDVSLSGSLVSTWGLVVADKEPHGKATFRLLTADGTERELLQVINMPEWSAALDFDDVLWIQGAAYQTGSMGSFRECRQVWRVDGLRAAVVANPSTD